MLVYIYIYNIYENCEHSAVYRGNLQRTLPRKRPDEEKYMIRPAGPASYTPDYRSIGAKHYISRFSSAPSASFGTAPRDIAAIKAQHDRLVTSASRKALSRDSSEVAMSMDIVRPQSARRSRRKKNNKASQRPLSARSPLRGTDVTPGPAEYSTCEYAFGFQRSSGRTSAPRTTFGSAPRNIQDMSDAIGKNKTPGPNQYNSHIVQQKLRKKNPSSHFGTAPRFSDKLITPRW